MKAENKVELKKSFEVGDEVWACAFKLTPKKEDRRFYCKPVRGMLVASYRKDLHEKLMNNDCKKSIEYFVPFKLNKADELAWSKAVQVDSRVFASTEEECKEMFNERVSKQINWFKKEIEELEKELL